MHILRRLILEDIENGKISFDALRDNPALALHLSKEKQLLWKQFLRNNAPPEFKTAPSPASPGRSIH